jgi:hypothetical protein
MMKITIATSKYAEYGQRCDHTFVVGIVVVVVLAVVGTVGGGCNDEMQLEHHRLICETRH